MYRTSEYPEQLERRNTSDWGSNGLFFVEYKQSLTCIVHTTQTQPPLLSQKRVKNLITYERLEAGEKISKNLSETSHLQPEMNGSRCRESHRLQ
jgi:hypothetical protein